jgi:hypothetical protein
MDATHTTPRPHCSFRRARWTPELQARLDARRLADVERWIKGDDARRARMEAAREAMYGGSK